MTGDLNTAFGHRQIYTPRRFYIFMRRTTISHFSFLISNFSFNRGFHPQSRDEPPRGLTLNPPTLRLYMEWYNKIYMTNIL